MKRLLVIGMLMLSVTFVQAGFYKLVGCECDVKADKVIITYIGAADEAGKKLMKDKSPHQWDPWSLVVTAKDRNHIASLKTVHSTCQLTDGIYEITFGPLPGNVNLQGMCGGFMSAWTEVRRGSEMVLPRHAFESGDCFNTGVPITVKITIEAGGKKPVIETIPWDDFYK